MLRHYGASVAGAYHLAAGEEGQDAFAVLRLGVDVRAGGAGVNEQQVDDGGVSDCGGGEVLLAAVADGLGSERFSGEGARAAADVAVRALAAASLGARGIASLDEPALSAVLEIAVDAVLAKAEEMGEDAGEFDSTLCLVAWDGDEAVYANAGDSGLVGLLRGPDGEPAYRLLTSMHRGEASNLVYPLKSRGQWEFGRVEGVRALLLATDGILEQIAGLGLGDDPAELNRAALDLFMGLGPEDAVDPCGLSRGLDDYLRRIDPVAVDDDKTVVVLYNDGAGDSGEVPVSDEPAYEPEAPDESGKPEYPGEPEYPSAAVRPSDPDDSERSLS